MWPPPAGSPSKRQPNRSREERPRGHRRLVAAEREVAELDGRRVLGHRGPEPEVDGVGAQRSGRVVLRGPDVPAVPERVAQPAGPGPVLAVLDRPLDDRAAGDGPLEGGVDVGHVHHERHRRALLRLGADHPDLGELVGHEDHRVADAQLGVPDPAVVHHDRLALDDVRRTPPRRSASPPAASRTARYGVSGGEAGRHVRGSLCPAEGPLDATAQLGRERGGSGRSARSVARARGTDPRPQASSPPS